MTGVCGARPWPDSCLRSLMQDLVSGDQTGLAMWIVDHCGSDDNAWSDFAIVVASMAATSFETIARARLREAGIPDAEIVFAPFHREHTVPIERDAGLLVTMAMNNDTAGTIGVLAAVRERDEFEELSGCLAIIATGALRAEALAILQGGLS